MIVAAQTVFVARTITEIFPRDENLDLAKQEEVLRNHYLHRALIPVPVGEDMSFFEEDRETFMLLASQNSICDIIMSDVPGQVMEGVEHILHFVRDTGLHFAFPAEWGISQDSEIAIAMNEAIEKGYYEIEQYDEFEDEEEHLRVLIQEFAYWVISTYWDLQEAYGPVGEAEWKLVAAQSPSSKRSAACSPRYSISSRSGNTSQTKSSAESAAASTSISQIGPSSPQPVGTSKRKRSPANSPSSGWAKGLVFARQARKSPSAPTVSPG